MGGGWEGGISSSESELPNFFGDLIEEIAGVWLSLISNSSYQNSMATLNDDQVAAILAEMRDSQTPAIAPIKSPKRRGSSDSEELRNSTLPAVPQASTDLRGFQLIVEQNRPDAPKPRNRSVSRKNTSANVPALLVSSTGPDRISDQTRTSTLTCERLYTRSADR